VLLKPGTPHQFVVSDDVGQALGWLLATLLCFVGLTKPGPRTRSHVDSILTTPLQRWIPILLAAGIFCQFIGQVVYTYLDARNMVDFPSLADVGYLSTFPFLFLGIMLLPTRPLSGFTRARVFLDGFIVITAAVTFSWFFVLGPTMLQKSGSVLSTIVGSAYPFFDLVLIFCVIQLSFPSSDPVLQPAIRLLSLSFIVIVITDSIYDYLTLQGIYHSGLQDIGWPIGYTLLGLAAQALNLARTREMPDSEAEPGKKYSRDAIIAASTGLRALLPYALIPAVIALTFFTWRKGVDVSLARGVYFGEIALIGLVLLRQFFTIRETIYYNKQLRQVQQEVHSKNQALSEANKQLEEQATQIAAAYEQERHVNELKDLFLANVNHELRTPLTAVHGYLELLQEYQGQLDAPSEANFINLAVQGCDELQQLVSNVLDAIQGDSQGKAPQIEALPVAGVVEEVINLFEPQKRQEYHVEVNIPGTLAVMADRQHLHQVLLNLLSNAFKYAPKDTTVALSAQLRDIPEGEGQQVCLCVQDAGVGIPPAEIPVLFGKFVRLRRDVVGPVGGTGLGLYICKQLVEPMGGRIWVESSGIVGEGSRFYFTLPAAPDISRQSERAGQERVTLAYEG